MPDVIIMHAQFERERPEERAYAEHAERTRQARHLFTHDSLAEYIPAREFPCPGWLKTVEHVGAIHVVVCDACGFETSMRPTATAGSEW